MEQGGSRRKSGLEVTGRPETELLPFEFPDKVWYYLWDGRIQTAVKGSVRFMKTTEDPEMGVDRHVGYNFYDDA